MTPKAELTQRRFSKLFADAQDVLEIQGVDLAKAVGKNPSTISRYRSPGYEFGPPEPAVRRILEDEMGLPRGYLDGEAEADLLALRRARRQQGGRSAGKGSGRQAEGGTGQDGARGLAHAPPAGALPMLESILAQLDAVRGQLEAVFRLLGPPVPSPRSGADPALDAGLVEPRRDSAPQTRRRPA